MGNITNKQIKCDIYTSNYVKTNKEKIISMFDSKHLPKEVYNIYNNDVLPIDQNIDLTIKKYDIIKEGIKENIIKWTDLSLLSQKIMVIQILARYYPFYETNLLHFSINTIDKIMLKNNKIKNIDMLFALKMATIILKYVDGVYLGVLKRENHYHLVWF